MKAYRLNPFMREVADFETIKSRSGMTEYLYRGITAHGLVKAELKDRQRSKLEIHPSNLHNVIVREG